MKRKETVQKRVFQALPVTTSKDRPSPRQAPSSRSPRCLFPPSPHRRPRHRRPDRRGRPLPHLPTQRLSPAGDDLEQRPHCPRPLCPRLPAPFSFAVQKARLRCASATGLRLARHPRPPTSLFLLVSRPTLRPAFLPHLPSISSQAQLGLSGRHLLLCSLGTARERLQQPPLICRCPFQSPFTASLQRTLYIRTTSKPRAQTTSANLSSAT